MSSKAMRLIHARQLASTLLGVNGEEFFPNDCDVEVSPSTGRIRRIWLNGVCLATVRASDGMFALTIDGAKRLLSMVSGVSHQVVVDDNGALRVKQGFDVNAAHVTEADSTIIPGHDVLVVDKSRQLLGVGKAVVSGSEMNALRRGTVVKVRHKV